MKANMIDIEQLTVVRQGTPLLQSIQLSLQPGSLHVLAGPNGAGKSTLLKPLAGLLRATSGKIFIGGEDTQAWSRQRWAQTVCYVPQLSAMTFPLTVREVLLLGTHGQTLTAAQIHTRIDEAMTRWDLTWAAETDVSVLSGGEQQRCQLARAWIQLQQSEMKVWLLDEPLSALDPRHQQDCMQAINKACEQGITVVMVAHDLNLARRAADKVILLQCGTLVAYGVPQTVLSVENVRSVFRVDAHLQGDFLIW
ncbi:MAG: ATP-binding cassette domain-containing protein [Oleibacter sp.]|nr:ATP-binding cassette domain-containing protein [Thalassolituus sp.]